MTATDHRKQAILALAESDHRAAGDAYTLAAYGELAGHEHHHREAFDQGWAGDGLQALLLAAVCYRIDGADERAANRATQARTIAEDQRDAVLDAPVDRAACEEFVGDALVVAGEQAAASAAYERATAGYERAAIDDPAGATTRPLLQAGTDLLLQLSRPDDVAWDDIHGTGSDALARRVRFRRSRLSAMVTARVEAGRLHPPRGSTEYNADFQCHDCGATDVNYVAGAVLCLRCVSVIERQ